MQRLEVSSAVQPLEWSLGVKGLNKTLIPLSLFQYLFQKALVSCVTGWYAQIGLESEGACK